MTIKAINARETLDSRGNPTIEVDVITEAGLTRAGVPSGASTGKYEALELRDGGKRYNGLGVLKAVESVRDVIAPRLIGKETINQKEIDELLIEMDGTGNKSKLGANAILGVSIAVCKAGALEKGIPLYKHIAEIAGVKEFVIPVPMVLVLEGGKHADQGSDIQEFMVVPYKAKNFKEAIRTGSEIYHSIGEVLKKQGFNINVGYEGAYGPSLRSNEKAFQIIVKGIKAAGYKPRDEVLIAIDCAASEFFKDDGYVLEGKKLTGEKLIEVYKKLITKYPIISIEDPFEQDDFDSCAKLTKEIGKSIQIVGDDLLVTNTERIQKAIHRDACNALLLKPNQIGTVTETIEACQLAQENGWGVMVSHRSGETTDSFIADLVVGLKTGQIKSGAPCRSERLAKYNQLIRIEEELGKQARYAGNSFRRPL